MGAEFAKRVGECTSPSPMACSSETGVERAVASSELRFGVCVCVCGHCGVSSGVMVNRLSSSYSSDYHCVHPPSVQLSCHRRVRIAVGHASPRRRRRSWRRDQAHCDWSLVPLCLWLSPRAAGHRRPAIHCKHTLSSHTYEIERCAVGCGWGTGAARSGST